MSFVTTQPESLAAAAGLIHDVKSHHPGFDMESVSQFAVIAAKYYCLQQLSKS
jgi:hypothetical protein